jgi:hypothetical protein
MSFSLYSQTFSVPFLIPLSPSCSQEKVRHRFHQDSAAPVGFPFRQDEKKTGPYTLIHQMTPHRREFDLACRHCAEPGWTTMLTEDDYHGPVELLRANDVYSW